MEAVWNAVKAAIHDDVFVEYGTVVEFHKANKVWARGVTTVIERQ